MILWLKFMLVVILLSLNGITIYFHKKLFIGLLVFFIIGLIAGIGWWSLVIVSVIELLAFFIDYINANPLSPGESYYYERSRMERKILDYESKKLFKILWSGQTFLQVVKRIENGSAVKSKFGDNIASVDGLIKYIFDCRESRPAAYDAHYQQREQALQKAEQSSLSKPEPTRKTYDEDKQTECIYCGSSSFGTGCVYGEPSPRLNGITIHKHNPDGRHCVYCGSRGMGTGCVFSPSGIHSRH